MLEINAVVKRKQFLAVIQSLAIKTHTNAGH